MLGSTGLFLLCKKRPVLNSNLTPQSLRDSPLGGTGKGFPDTPSVASLRVRIPSCAYLQPPQSLRDGPLGGTGKGFPDTPSVASLRVRIPSCAYLHPPQSLRDSPLGGTGKGFPDTPSVASLRWGALGRLGWLLWEGWWGKKTTVCGFCRSLCSLGSCGGTGCLCREGKR